MLEVDIRGMQELQEIYNRMQAKKSEQREIKSVYNDVLAGKADYQEISKKLKELREKKKRIEAQVMAESKDFKRIETLKMAINSDAGLLADAALAKLLKGEHPKVTDERQNTYEPRFSVKFKRAGSQ